MAWLYLAIAVVSEVIGTLALKASDGMSKIVPAITVVIAYLTAFFLMSQTLKTIPVGITYAVWSGLGIVGATLGAYFLFGQALSRQALIGMVIIIIGVVILNLNQN
ncbi:MAG: Methyl viologen resistance protein [Actinomycetota bacterium]|jgi:small multidrug resistance pump